MGSCCTKESFDEKHTAGLSPDEKSVYKQEKLFPLAKVDFHEARLEIKRFASHQRYLTSRYLIEIAGKLNLDPALIERFPKSDQAKVFKDTGFTYSNEKQGYDSENLILVCFLYCHFDDVD